MFLIILEKKGVIPGTYFKQKKFKMLEEMLYIYIYGIDLAREQSM